MQLIVDSSGHVAVFWQGRGERVPLEDFPAAHSMDTTWYAVDQAGHVALFSSNEEGAVPLDAHNQYWEELIEDICLCRALKAVPTLKDRQILQSDFEQGSVRAVSYSDLPFQWNGVLVFESNEYLQIFRDEYYHAECERIDPDIAPHAVKVRDIIAVGFEDYWQAGAIVSAVFLPNARVSPAKLGLYEYDCGFSGPYQRAKVPSDPIELADLPVELRDRLSKLRMSFRFATMKTVDPDKIAKCYHYRS